MATVPAEMEQVYQSLATSTLSQYDTLSSRAPKARLLIAVAGPPGSGKTTSTTAIAKIINAQTSCASAPLAMSVSMDGYHWPRSYLDTLPNRDEAYVRRGAPWTFNSDAIIDLVRQLRSDRGGIYVPTFDHAAKDPVADGLFIPGSMKIILLEGNYLLVDEKPWCEIRDVVDSCWLVTVDAEVARQRVARRHVLAGIERDMESALARVDGNDTLNGLYIMEHSRSAADVIIKSLSY